MGKKPLENRTIAITRAAAQADEFAKILADFGARTVSIPVIKICPLDTPEINRALQKVNNYSWIVFTSSNGAATFLRKLGDIMPPEDLKPRIGAIGPGTARQIEQLGFQVNMVPGLFQAEGILEEFSRNKPSEGEGLSILIPRAAQAREILPITLREMGMRVDVLPVYTTSFPSGRAQELRALLAGSSPDMITFTSSSTVTNFIKMAGKKFELNVYKYASIGPVTTETAINSGIEITVKAEESTLESLAEAIAGYFTKTSVVSGDS